MGDAIALIATHAAQGYLLAHRLDCDNAKLAACLSKHTRLRLKEALEDAKEAFACGMEQVGLATFKATMIQAGIDAAKEATTTP